MDRFTPSQRSALMSKVRGKNTRPEERVRSILHHLGFRFRLHRKDLPGTPDIVLPKYRTVIFVHGCFWHRHPGCKKASMPQTNKEFWERKLARNVERDAVVSEKLTRIGWRVLVVWECELKNSKALSSRLLRELMQRTS
jgi:DNA mismatch endonuclease (patch repair protein)